MMQPNATIKNLKNRANQFERRLDRELDRVVTTGAIVRYLNRLAG